MGLFSFLRGANINDGVQQFDDTEGAVLVDVRDKDEYRQGHIPGSVNVPLQSLTNIKKYAGKDTPLFVYCLSGARSGRAVGMLVDMGYKTVTNIGGIASYRGEIER
ncbi:MAG: rhodanese-like domain-containing protein [Hornefia sp.]|nr:rhodanese-like domain-containing protein [Hornefia sp.]